MSAESARTSHALVTVVIPTYRRAHLVRAAAESALSQTWPNLEVLIVSDGPDAETKRSVEDLDPRLRYIELSHNQGPAAARNAGVQQSRGTWLAFLDDDDLMLPDKIEQQMRLANTARPLQMIACRTFYRCEEQVHLWPKKAIGPRQDLADYILRRPSLLGRPGILTIQSLLLHRSIVEQIPFASHKDHEDWAWLLEVWHVLGARVVFCWEPLVVYNIDTESVSRSRRLNWEDSLAWADQHRHWIGDAPYCSFLATKAAFKAKRAGDWRGFGTITRKVLTNRPSALDLTFLLGVAALPGSLLQGAWKRSLRSKKKKSTSEEVLLSVASESSTQIQQT